MALLTTSTSVPLAPSVSQPSSIASSLWGLPEEWLEARTWESLCSHPPTTDLSSIQHFWAQAQDLDGLSIPRLAHGLSLLAVFAAREGHRDVLLWILDTFRQYRVDFEPLGAHVNCFDGIIVAWCAHRGSERTLKECLLYGADPTLADSRAMRWACQSGHLRVMKLLEEEGCSVWSQPDETLRILTWLQERHAYGVIRWIEERRPVFRDSVLPAGF